MAELTEKVEIRKLIEDEIKKCAKSPQYFIRKYCYIQHPTKGKILFDLYNYQDGSITDFETHQFNIILKGRQIGISTAVACYALWIMIFHRDKAILVIATKEDTAKNMVTKVRYAYDFLPVWLRVPTEEKNKLSMRFNNGSQIKASTAAEDAGRSEALSLLILDEAAFIKNAEDIWTAAFPTLSTGGRAVLISTPNGVGNFFHKKYMDAISGRKEGNEDASKFHPIKLDWSVHPDRDLLWRKRMGVEQGETKARQEYDAEFLGSGANVFDPFKLEELKNKLGSIGENSIPVGKSGINGDSGCWIWEYPNPNHRYVVCADVSRGDATDWSTCHVLDIDDPSKVEQVAEYQGRPSTTAFGQFLVELAVRYNQALLIVERENVGWAVVQTVINIGYHNLFYMSKDYRIVDIHRNVVHKYFAEENKMIPGFGTNTVTRPLIINKLDTYINQGFVNVRSIRSVNEMEVFIWDKGKAQAMQGYNDDLIMALGIGLWVRDTALLLQQQGVDFMRSALDSFQRVGSGSGDAIYTPLYIQQNPYQMPLGTRDGQSMDLRWLLG
jgi:hypothetical protein